MVETARLTFSPTSTNGDLLASVKDPLSLDDGVVHLGLEDLEEAGLADLLTSLGTLDERSSREAQLARCWRHAAVLMVLSQYKIAVVGPSKHSHSHQTGGRTWKSGLRVANLIGSRKGVCDVAHL